MKERKNRTASIDGGRVFAFSEAEYSSYVGQWMSSQALESWGKGKEGWPCCRRYGPIKIEYRIDKIHLKVEAISDNLNIHRHPNMESISRIAAKSFRATRNTAPLQPAVHCRRCLQTSASIQASPIPHPVAPAPPPDAPTPTNSSYGERIDRRRRQAELLQRGQALRANPKKPSAALQKRFWKEVSVKDTPGKRRLH